MYSIYLIFIYLVLIAIKPTRKLALALLPWLIFACSYDAMRLYPNYEINPIDLEGIYDMEKSLFGISYDGSLLIPGEFFAINHCALADILAGIFYLCWVPLPLAFGIYLYFKGDKKNYLRFSYAFLLVNFLGFCGYYIHPAAPPWYVMYNGFTAVLNTPGNVAGLARFDELIGFPVFHSIYCNNSNVFAAVPSLHSAYMLIATIYAVISRQHKVTVVAFAIITCGIWFTAVYSAHHYVIDVVLGILTAFLAVGLLEKGILRNKKIHEWGLRYLASI